MIRRRAVCPLDASEVMLRLQQRPCSTAWHRHARACLTEAQAGSHCFCRPQLVLLRMAPLCNARRQPGEDRAGEADPPSSHPGETAPGRGT